MVRRSTLINFCAALLSSSSLSLVTADTSAAASNNNSSVSNSGRSTNLRGRILQVATPASADVTSDAADFTAKKSVRGVTNVADFAAGIAAYSAAYDQAMKDEDDEAADMMAMTSGDDDNTDHVVLMKEDFSAPSSKHFFTSNGNNVEYETNIHGRNGVIQLQHNSYITTTNNLLPPSSSFSTFTITFSYLTTHMSTPLDNFCLDFSTDGGKTWHDEECYNFGTDFENGFWYDGVGVQFDKEDLSGGGVEDSLSLRWIVVNGGELFLDEVQVVASSV